MTRRPLDTPREALDAFMSAYQAGTVLHPFAHWLRVWEGRACLESKVWEGAVWLDCIQALDPGQGNGAACLRWFLALADQHRVPVRGAPSTK